MSTDTYIHKMSRGRDGAPVIFAFHGTGADENQFFAVCRELLPDAHIVAPRGDVLEHGAARYFRRTGEGVYDMDDLAARTRKMTAFMRALIEELAPSAVLGLGYSNGANILASVLFATPDLVDGAVLMHPLIPFAPDIRGDLTGRSHLITAGRHDPICPPAATQALEDALRGKDAAVETVWHEGGHEVRPSELDAAAAFLSAWRG